MISVKIIDIMNRSTQGTETLIDDYLSSTTDATSATPAEEQNDMYPDGDLSRIHFFID